MGEKHSYRSSVESVRIVKALVAASTPNVMAGLTLLVDATALILAEQLDDDEVFDQTLNDFITNLRTSAKDYREQIKNQTN